MVRDSVFSMGRGSVRKMNSPPTRIDLEVTNLRHQPQKMKFFDFAPVSLRFSLAIIAKRILLLSVAFRA
jgi:hypothetical protein